jgi:hypothetical protein
VQSLWTAEAVKSDQGAKPRTAPNPVSFDEHCQGIILLIDLLNRQAEKELLRHDQIGSKYYSFIFVTKPKSPCLNSLMLKLLIFLAEALCQAGPAFARPDFAKSGRTLPSQAGLCQAGLALPGRTLPSRAGFAKPAFAKPSRPLPSQP